MSGANAATAGGTVTYKVYSDSACTVSAGSPGPVTVTGGKVPASSGVTLTAPGTYYWTASYSGDGANGPSSSACGAETETVNQTAVLDHLVLSPATATIAAGTAQAYTATGFDTHGNSLGDVTAATTLSISPNGAGTGAACNNTAHTCAATQAGTYTVTGTDAGKTGTATLTVKAAGLDHLVLSPATATIAAGTAQAYTATGFDAYGNSLGDVTAATTLAISPNGTGTGASCNNTAHTCTATQAGTYTVTGTDAGKTGTATLTVNSAAAASGPVAGDEHYRRRHSPGLHRHRFRGCLRQQPG